MFRLIATSAFLLSLMGCQPAPERTDRAENKQLTIRVLKADEHLGHSTAAAGSSAHPVWCDGCRGQIVGKKEEELMVWWNNGDNPLQLQDGKTYTLHVQGELGDGVMGFQGKSIHVGQVLKIEESPQP